MSDIVERLRAGIPRPDIGANITEKHPWADEAAAEIERLRAALTEANVRAWRLANEITNDELKLVDKHCDWPAFKHAYNAIMKARRAALNPSPPSQPEGSPFD